jgi:hypothetical protein
VAAHAVGVRREPGLGGGTCWWKAPWICEVAALVDRGASRSWHSPVTSGCRGSGREATWGVSDSDHLGRSRLTTPTSAFGRDTVQPPMGRWLDSSWPRQHQLLGYPGLAGQQWSSSVATSSTARKAELPLGSRRGKARGGQRGESPKLGNGVFLRVLVTTSRLQRLVRGIFLGGTAA